MKHALLRYCLLIIFSINITISFSQDTSTDALQSAIEQKSYTYQVQSVTPMKGGMRQLNPGYALTIKGDTLVVNLPYFGRVYQAAYGGDGGFNFTSYQFDYQIKTRKKGGWDISIKTKDQPSQRKFNLTVTKTGSASMTVLCSDRESISYYGSLDTEKK